MVSVIRSIQTLVAGAVAIELYLPEFEDSNTGMFKRDNWPKDELETRPIWTNANDSIVSPVDKKSYGATVKQYGDGDRNFKMILQHACYGQQRISMNAIIRLSQCWHMQIISL